MSAPPVRVTIAKRDVRWTSIRARNKAAPDKWGCYVGKVLLLKDTRKSVYNNELVAPNRFQYEIPAFSTYAWERQLIERIQSDWDACRTTVVHLFSTPGSRNEYYGEWVVADLAPNPDRVRNKILHLRRLADQDPTVTSSYAIGPVKSEQRSPNERWHGRVLDETLPSGYIVDHEPETLMDLHDPTVVDGEPQDLRVLSDSYTTDYVVTGKGGLVRLCIESKANERDMNLPGVFEKCRVLRDRVMLRVVIMVGGDGDPAKIRYFDFGPPRLETPREDWIESLSDILP